MADLLETVEGGVATLTLNRADSLNALSSPMIEALLDAFDRLGRDSGVGAVVLRAAGRAFCAGGDVKSMSDAGSPQQKLDWVRWAHRLPLAVTGCPKVTIASIQGPAMGAGLGLALCCDFRIAARGAKFGLAFVKMGLATDFGVSWQLPRIVGEARARELMLTGDIFDAAAAQAMGLTTRVVEDEMLASETLTWAQRFTAGPVLAQAAIKRNLVASQSLGFAELMDYEAAQQIHATETDDHKEAVKAFLERRAPVFRGR
jgi:2-(1,2-epoxy-1,2-dihydrophenyl)acetyl-CoA isomerase